MIENPTTMSPASEGIRIARMFLDGTIKKQMIANTVGIDQNEAHRAHLSICCDEIAHALERFNKETGSTIDQAKFEWWPEGAVKQVDLHVQGEDQ